MTGNSMRAVFLDRDGVINANVLRDGVPVAPTSLSDFRILPGVPQAVRRLKDAGLVVVVVTNQPDVRTGRTTQDILDAMHWTVREQLPVDDIKVCPHIDADRCACRKPNPGMILAAAREHNLDLSRSYLVGDRWKDTLAGRAVGCFTLFVDDGTPQEKAHEADCVVPNLPAAVDRILSEERSRSQASG